MNNLPAAFKERMRMMLKEESSDFFDALQKTSPVSIRFNPDKYAQNDIFPTSFIEKQVHWCSDALYLKERPVFTLDPCFHGGAYYVQEASSMFLQHIIRQLNLQRDSKVLDLCAAPGGKSTLLASALAQESLLVSNEVIRSRASILKENVIRWGHHNIVVTNSDPLAFSGMKGMFDLILVDAPCSGEGMFRKDPKAIEEWSEANLHLCSERQKRILTDIWDALKPEGYLIYSTCTYNPEENEDIIEWILRQYPATSLSINHTFPEITPSESTASGYHFFPHKTNGEGFFISVIQKQDGIIHSPERNKRQQRIKTITIPPEIALYLRNTEEMSFYIRDEITGIVPQVHEEFIQYLENKVRIVYKGCELAEINNKKLKPLHPLALYNNLERSCCNSYDTERNIALKYLKKEEIPVMAKAGEWVLICHNNIALGWGKSLGYRLNNYFPKEWRIRMDITNEMI